MKKHLVPLVIRFSKAGIAENARRVRLTGAAIPRNVSPAKYVSAGTSGVGVGMVGIGGGGGVDSLLDGEEGAEEGGEGGGGEMDCLVGG